MGPGKLGGGGAHIFGMFCPNRRIHARIRASPENQRGWGGGDSCTLFFARQKKLCLLLQHRHKGTRRLLKFLTTYFDKQASKKKVARIIPEFCANFARFLPEFYISKVGKGHSAPCPPPPPSRTPMS